MIFDLPTKILFRKKIKPLKDLTVDDIDVYQKFKNQFDQRLKFTSPYDPDEAPIITLAESVSSWNVGDQIVIGRILKVDRVQGIFRFLPEVNSFESINRL